MPSGLFLSIAELLELHVYDIIWIEVKSMPDGTYKVKYDNIDIKALMSYISQYTYEGSIAATDVTAFDPCLYSDIYEYADGSKDGSSANDAFNASSGGFNPGGLFTRNYGYPTMLPYMIAGRLNRCVIADVFAKMSDSSLQIGNPVVAVQVSIGVGNPYNIYFRNIQIASKQQINVRFGTNTLYYMIYRINRQGSAQDNKYWSGSAWTTTKTWIQRNITLDGLDLSLTIGLDSNLAKWRYLFAAYTSLDGITSMKTSVMFDITTSSGGNFVIKVADYTTELGIIEDDLDTDNMHNIYMNRHFYAQSGAGYAQLPMFGKPFNVV